MIRHSAEQRRPKVIYFQTKNVDYMFLVDISPVDIIFKEIKTQTLIIMLVYRFVY